MADMSNENNITSKKSKNINEEVKKKKYVCGTNPNKCPFLSYFFVEHVKDKKIFYIQ